MDRHETRQLFSFHVEPRTKGQSIGTTTSELFDCDERIRLYQLTDLATQIAEIQGTTTPKFCVPHHLILASDHGFFLSPGHQNSTFASIKWATEVARGQHFVNYLCRQHGFALRIANTGLAVTPSPALGIVNVSLGQGTQHFYYGDAMTPEQLSRCIDSGRQLVTNIASQGCNVLSIGLLAHGTRIPAAIWVVHLVGIPLEKSLSVERLERWGNADLSLAHLKQHIESVQENIRTLPELMQHYGGFELVVAVAALLQAAELRMTILIDSFPILAALYAAYTIAPSVTDYCILTHIELLEGMEILAARLNIAPVLRLGLSASEGVGALEAYGIINSALHLLQIHTNGISR